MELTSDSSNTARTAATGGSARLDYLPLIAHLQRKDSS